MQEEKIKGRKKWPKINRVKIRALIGPAQTEKITELGFFKKGRVKF